MTVRPTRSDSGFDQIIVSRKPYGCYTHKIRTSLSNNRHRWASRDDLAHHPRKAARKCPLARDNSPAPCLEVRDEILRPAATHRLACHAVECHPHERHEEGLQREAIAPGDACKQEKAFRRLERALGKVEHGVYVVTKIYQKNCEL